VVGFPPNRNFAILHRMILAKIAELGCSNGLLSSAPTGGPQCELAASISRWISRYCHRPESLEK
jgi:hypothetical protein